MSSAAVPAHSDEDPILMDGEGLFTLSDEVGAEEMQQNKRKRLLSSSLEEDGDAMEVDSHHEDDNASDEDYEAVSDDDDADSEPLSDVDDELEEEFEQPRTTYATRKKSRTSLANKTLSSSSSAGSGRSLRARTSLPKRRDTLPGSRPSGELPSIARSGISSSSVSSSASASSASSASPGIVVENEGVVSARTYDYVGEAQCDANTQIFLDSIDTVAALPYKNAFAAIKLTALGNPQLLERLSQILVEIRELFEETFAPGQEHIDLAGFRAGLKATGIELSDEESKLLFEHFDEGMTGTIDIVDWTRKINFANMATRPFFTRSGFNFCPQGDSVPLLDETEARLMGNLSSRLDAIAEKAVAKNVQLMIDAEHTYFQPAINHFVLHLQCKHNVDRPLIFNTYQCYLTHSYRHLCNDLERAQRFGFYFAGKLVRGAYMVLERERAARKGYPDPIMPTLQATHDNYNRCVTEVLKHSDMARVMLASHNEHSIVSCVNQMNKENIDRQNGGVFFGQLLGMADHLTFTLARHGYQVFKYVPYGPVNEVIPYLVRRAQENADIMGGGELERELLRKELFARFFGRKK